MCYRFRVQRKVPSGSSSQHSSTTLRTRRALSLARELLAQWAPSSQHAWKLLFMAPARGIGACYRRCRLGRMKRLRLGSKLCSRRRMAADAGPGELALAASTAANQ